MSSFKRKMEMIIEVDKVEDIADLVPKIVDGQRAFDGAYGKITIIIVGDAQGASRPLIDKAAVKNALKKLIESYGEDVDKGRSVASSILANHSAANVSSLEPAFYESVYNAANIAMK